MYKPTSKMERQRKTKPYVDRFNESVAGWHQPNELELVRVKPTYSPMGTPPRLRTLVTPPGTEPYRNSYNLRRLNSPLPSLDDMHTPPVRLDTWGLDPTDYRLNQDLHSFIRQPSPLTNYGLGNKNHKQKKSYIVVPRLSNITTPPVSSNGIHGTFSMPSHRTIPSYVPDSQYKYLERINAFSPKYQREPSDYAYVRRNEAFASRFIDDFIGKCIEDQYIPDILLEIIGELDRENKKQEEQPSKPEPDRYLTELHHRISQKGSDSSHLFSDDWIRELDYQRPPLPLTNIDFNRPLTRKIDLRELVSDPTETTYPRYHSLPPNSQDYLLTDIIHEVVNSEVTNMTTKLSSETLNDTSHNSAAVNDIYRDIESETIRELARDTAYDVKNTQTNYVNEVQLNAIEKNAQNKLLDTIFMDQLLAKYIRQNGSVVDVDDLSRFLDATILDNLIYHSQDIKDSRSRTLDNYALRKFHLNSFMNMTMDLLLTELSASLIEDMKDLDEQERRVF